MKSLWIGWWLSKGSQVLQVSDRDSLWELPSLTLSSPTTQHLIGCDWTSTQKYGLAVKKKQLLAWGRDPSHQSAWLLYSGHILGGYTFLPSWKFRWVDHQSAMNSLPDPASWEPSSFTDLSRQEPFRRETVRAVIQTSQQTVLVKHSGSWRAQNCWSTPGGGIDPFDGSHVQALMRELGEELEFASPLQWEGYLGTVTTLMRRHHFYALSGGLPTGICSPEISVLKAHKPSDIWQIPDSEFLVGPEPVFAALPLR